MPIDRAVPRTICSAASRSLALRSASLVCAISRTCSRVTVATFVLCGSPEPFSTPAALSSSRAAGGVLVMNVNDRSSKTEISTGTIIPRCDSVCALYCLQNSMMFTPCWPSAGPTGGAGVAAPALICSLMTAESFFLGGMGILLDLRDLVVRQLDRGLPAEDGDQHPELLVVGVDLADGGRQRRERAVHDGDGLADLEVDLARDDDLLLFDRGEDLEDLFLGQRAGAVGLPDEAGDARGVAYGAPRLVGEVHPDQQVAGEHLLLDGLPLAALDLGDLLGGHLDLEDVVLHVERGDPGLEVGLHLVLVAGVGVHDVPVAGRRVEHGGELVVLVALRLRELGGLGLGGAVGGVGGEVAGGVRLAGGRYGSEQ